MPPIALIPLIIVYFGVDELAKLLAPSIDRDLGQSPTARANATAPGPDPMIPAGMADEELVNALAQYLDLEPIEKQALLERQCLRSRAESLVELLEMKLMLGRTRGASHVAH